MYPSLSIKPSSIANGMFWEGGRVGCAACVYLKCKWNFFSKANARRGDLEFPCLWTYSVHLPFTGNHPYQTIFQAWRTQDLMNLIAILMWKSGLGFLHFSWRSRTPEKFKKKKTLWRLQNWNETQEWLILRPEPILKCCATLWVPCNLYF